MSKVSDRNRLKIRRKRRIRKKVSGTAERPRLSVFRSAKHVFAQVIDDDSGKTLAYVSSISGKGTGARANVDRCAELGKKIAESCKSQSISKVVFDRNGNAFHGRIKAFADGAREAGLEL
jgi:large subunit ribosomal protein L18